MGNNDLWPFDPNGKFDGQLSCEEEVWLRAELCREIGMELERKLMDGSLVLVRRLSDLKVKQFLRELGDARGISFMSDENYGVGKTILGGELNRRRDLGGDW